MDAKRYPKDPKVSRKGAKREPKDDQNGSQNQCLKKVEKMTPKRRAHPTEMAPKIDPKSIKNVMKNRCKIRRQKSDENQ